jgi:hypothetical protein
MWKDLFTQWDRRASAAENIPAALIGAAIALAYALWAIS